MDVDFGTFSPVSQMREEIATETFTFEDVAEVIERVEARANDVSPVGMFYAHLADTLTAYHEGDLDLDDLDPLETAAFHLLLTAIQTEDDR